MIPSLTSEKANTARWQSGLLTVAGRAKTSHRMAMLPLAHVSRTGVRTVLWGQVRPGTGRQRYVLQQYRDGGWRAVGGIRTTTSRGFLTRTVRAGKGAKFRIWYPVDRATSPLVQVS